MGFRGNTLVEKMEKNVRGDEMIDNDNIKTLTRADLTESVYREIGFSYSESSELVDLVLEELTACLEEGNDVKLSSFGSFKVREKQARVGRNPKTKESAVITARKVVTFHASNMLKKRINDGAQQADIAIQNIKNPISGKINPVKTKVSNFE